MKNLVLLAVFLLTVMVMGMMSPSGAQAQNDAAWQASFEASVGETGLQQAIAAQLQAGVPVADIMAALFAMEGVNPSAAIQAAIQAGADQGAVTAAANAAGISPALVASAVSAGQAAALAYTPPAAAAAAVGGVPGGGPAGGGGYVSPASP